MIKFLIIIFGLLTCFCSFGQGTDVGKESDDTTGFWCFMFFGVITLFFIMVS